MSAYTHEEIQDAEISRLREENDRLIEKSFANWERRYTGSLAERIVSRIVDKVSTLKCRLPKSDYRKIVHRLAELERAEEAEDYFSDPSNEPAYTDEERDNAEATIIGF